MGSVGSVHEVNTTQGMAWSLPAWSWQCQRSPRALLENLAVGGGQGGQAKGISRTVSQHGPHQQEELGI